MRLLPEEKRDRKLAVASARLFVSSARVNINSLDWNTGGRLLDLTNVTRLVNIFAQYECQRFNKRYWVDVEISEEQLKHILNSSHLTLNDLRDPLKDNYLPLLNVPESFKIRCKFGKYRLCAALQFFEGLPGKPWWAVNIYYAPRRKGFYFLLDFHANFI